MTTTKGKSQSRLVAKLCLCHREAQYRSDAEDLQNKMNRHADENNAKMVKLNELEIKIRDERAQLDLDLAQYGRE